MRLLIERIDVSPDGISVTLHAAGVRSLVAELASEQAAAAELGHAAMMEAADCSHDGGRRLVTERTSHEFEILTIRIPIRLQRRGGRKLLMTPEGAAAPAPKPRRDETLVKALVRAHRWRRRIESGQAKSITDLAEQEGVTDAYVCRLLPLTCLAPDIVEAILDGRQPKGLRLAEMLGNGPPSWEEQRDAWLSPERCALSAYDLKSNSFPGRFHQSITHWRWIRGFAGARTDPQLTPLRGDTKAVRGEPGQLELAAGTNFSSLNPILRSSSWKRG